MFLWRGLNQTDTTHEEAGETGSRLDGGTAVGWNHQRENTVVLQ